MKSGTRTIIPDQCLLRSGQHTSTSGLSLVLALLTCLLLSACNTQDSLPEAVQDLTFKTLTGTELVLAEATGPLLINFWATDCVICLREMPDLVELYNDYKLAGFQMVAVAMPYDPPNRVLEMAEREQWPFPVALDISGEAVNSFTTVKGTPTSYLLDKDGKLIERYVGAIPFDKLQSQLNKLLGSS
ncbi:MAG: TlpA disulfide reductase family protein [Granulosicoccus sp.]